MILTVILTCSPNMWSPERNPVLREYAIKIPKEHSAMENDSPRSRCPCSAGHSPVSSPIALRCRPTRLSNLLNKNEVLDRYMDIVHEDATVNEKQKQYSSATSMILIWEGHLDPNQQYHLYQSQRKILQRAT